MSERRPVPAVGVVCLRGDEVLLIRRGKPPRQGEWSLPGGRVEWGETVEAAALRELAEETGVVAELTGLLAVVDGVFPSADKHYVLVDYAARWLAGEPRAGDDATEAHFTPLAQIGALGLWSETVRIIGLAVGGAGVIAPSPPAGVAPAPARADDLAFELGRAHALRQLCFGRADGLWREQMSGLLKAEAAKGARSQALILRFNAGFADARAAFGACGEPAEAALRESAARGAALAHALAAPRP